MHPEHFQIGIRVSSVGIFFAFTYSLVAWCKDLHNPFPVGLVPRVDGVRESECLVGVKEGSSFQICGN